MCCINRAAAEGSNDTIMAAQRVLFTTELLEIVLLQLPVYTLFTIRRTSKMFERTICGSTRIRRAMFLEPDISSNINNPFANPLLGKPFERSLIHIPTRDCNRTGDSLFELSDGSYLDVEYYTVLRPGHWSGRWLTADFELTRDPDDEARVRESQFLLPKHPDAHESWRDMLLMQPPPLQIQGSLFRRPSAAIRGSSSTAWLHGHSRLGDVFEWLEQQTAAYEKIGPITAGVTPVV